MSEIKLTPHFSIHEVETTSTGIPNKVPNGLLGAVLYTAGKMEHVRALLGNKAIRVNSWYRSPAVNAAVGGSSTSQHPKGEAVDFVCPSFGDAYKIAKFLETKVGELNYDQLIFEQTWVHISFKKDGVNRNQNLTFKSGKYSAGIHV